tara:strand:+ start:133 stop:417 length:285 start_codon:yes stop_codon:yes gene_type:complete
MKKQIIWTDELVQQYAYFYCHNKDWKGHKGTTKSKQKMRDFKKRVSDTAEFIQDKPVVNSEKESHKTILWQDFRHVPDGYNKTETSIINQSKLK